MKFGSVCSGIEAASVAWNPLGWQAAWLSEIDPFPSAVLAHHYPDVPNLGDMTTLPERILSGEVEAPDLFCGGTPCQAFSVAGLRNSLDDARGNLSLTFVGIANAIDHVRSVRGDDPTIIFWENVPGVLSTKDNAFGCFLGALAGEDDPLIAPGGKWTNAGCVYGPQRAVAWRVLDAQYFGVAQRRRRVFVVASARDDFDPAKVLFEFDGLRRDSAPGREAGEAVAPCVTNGPPFSRTGNERVECEAIITMAHGQGGAGGSHRKDSDNFVPHGIGPGGQCARALTAAHTATGRLDPHEATFVSQPIAWDEELNASIDQAGTILRGGAGGRHDGVMQPIPIDSMNHLGRGDAHSFGDFQPGAPSYTLTKGHSHAVAQPVAAVAFQERGREHGREIEIGGDVAYALTAPNGGGRAQERNVMTPTMQVRRLTPVECERLQGFPDNYTNIPWRKKTESPDGPRYKALGNSWAVPNVRWIGQRIAEQLKTHP